MTTSKIHICGGSEGVMPKLNNGRKGYRILSPMPTYVIYIIRIKTVIPTICEKNSALRWWVIVWISSKNKTQRGNNFQRHAQRYNALLSHVSLSPMLTR